jgi:Cu-Zn family superoxide dismutase
MNNVTGTVTFTQLPDGKVKVVADITGLPPNSTHGFHIHEKGDLSAADLSSAGGHYNPEGHPHAGPTHWPRHAGDFGNITADANGKAHLELTVDNISLGGAKNDVIGKAVIVHANADDLTSQPSGNAGGRVAGGIIEMKK